MWRAFHPDALPGDVLTDEELKMLDEVLSADDAGLSPKALDFIDKLDNNRGMSLSVAQGEWLSDLADKVA